MGTNSYVFQVPPFMGNQETTIEELDAKKQHQRSHPMESALDHWTNPRLLPATAVFQPGYPPTKGCGLAVSLMDFLRSSGTKNQWKSAFRPKKLTMKPIFLSWRYDEWTLFETTTSDRWFKMCKAGIRRRYCCFSKTQSCWKKSGEKTACYLRNPIKTLGYSNHINDCENLPDFWLPSMSTYHIGSNLPLRFGKMRIARKATSLAPL